MLSFLNGKNDSVSLRSLEDNFLRETEFDKELSKLDKNARTSNRRRFKELISKKVSESKDYELIKYVSRNNNRQNNNNKYVSITEKGKDFHKFVLKRTQFPLASMIKQYKSFQRRRVLKNVLLALGVIILIGLIVIIVTILIAYIGLQLEGVLWAPNNSTSIKAIFFTFN